MVDNQINKSRRRTSSNFRLRLLLSSWQPAGLDTAFRSHQLACSELVMQVCKEDVNECQHAG